MEERKPVNHWTRGPFLPVEKLSSYHLKTEVADCSNNIRSQKGTLSPILYCLRTSLSILPDSQIVKVAYFFFLRKQFSTYVHTLKMLIEFPGARGLVKFKTDLVKQC